MYIDIYTYRHSQHIYIIVLYSQYVIMSMSKPTHSFLAEGFGTAAILTPFLKGAHSTRGLYTFGHEVI